MWLMIISRIISASLRKSSKVSLLSHKIANYRPPTAHQRVNLSLLLTVHLLLSLSLSFSFSLFSSFSLTLTFLSPYLPLSLRPRSELEAPIRLQLLIRGFINRRTAIGHYLSATYLSSKRFSMLRGNRKQRKTNWVKRETERQRETERETEKQRERQRERERQKEKQRNRERQRDKEREWEAKEYWLSCCDRMKLSLSLLVFCSFTFSSFAALHISRRLVF